MLCIVPTPPPHIHAPHSNWCALLKFAYFYCDVKHDSCVRCERALLRIIPYQQNVA